MKSKATKIQATIKRLNTSYKKSTPAQRRVMIAKDALEQINAERFLPVTGTYTSVQPPGCRALIIDDPLQPILHQPGTQCECCGVGAIFLSYVRLNNKATYRDGHDLVDIMITTGWPEGNLMLIEYAFECYHASYDDKTDVYKAAEFGGGYPDDTKRLEAILTNIVRNKGTFKP